MAAAATITANSDFRLFMAGAWNERQPHRNRGDEKCPWVDLLT